MRHHGRHRPEARQARQDVEGPDVEPNLDAGHPEHGLERLVQPRKADLEVSLVGLLDDPLVAERIPSHLEAVRQNRVPHACAHVTGDGLRPTLQDFLPCGHERSQVAVHHIERAALAGVVEQLAYLTDGVVLRGGVRQVVAPPERLQTSLLCLEERPIRRGTTQDVGGLGPEPLQHHRGELAEQAIIGGLPEVRRSTYRARERGLRKAAKNTFGLGGTNTDLSQVLSVVSGRNDLVALLGDLVFPGTDGFFQHVATTGDGFDSLALRRYPVLDGLAHRVQGGLVVIEVAPAASSRQPLDHFLVGPTHDLAGHLVAVEMAYLLGQGWVVAPRAPAHHITTGAHLVGEPAVVTQSLLGHIQHGRIPATRDTPDHVPDGLLQREQPRRIQTQLLLAYDPQRPPEADENGRHPEPGGDGTDEVAGDTHRLCRPGSCLAQHRQVGQRFGRRGAPHPLQEQTEAPRPGLRLDDVAEVGQGEFLRELVVEHRLRELVRELGDAVVVQHLAAHDGLHPVLRRAPSLVHRVDGSVGVVDVLGQFAPQLRGDLVLHQLQDLTVDVTQLTEGGGIHRLGRYIVDEGLGHTRQATERLEVVQERIPVRQRDAPVGDTPTRTPVLAYPVAVGEEAHGAPVARVAVGALQGVLRLAERGCLGQLTKHLTRLGLAGVDDVVQLRLHPGQRRDLRVAHVHREAGEFVVDLSDGTLHLRDGLPRHPTVHRIADDLGYLIGVLRLVDLVSEGSGDIELVHDASEVAFACVALALDLRGDLLHGALRLRRSDQLIRRHREAVERGLSYASQVRGSGQRCPSSTLAGDLRRGLQSSTHLADDVERVGDDTGHEVQCGGAVAERDRSRLHTGSDEDRAPWADGLRSVENFLETDGFGRVGDDVDANGFLGSVEDTRGGVSQLHGRLPQNRHRRANRVAVEHLHRLEEPTQEPERIQALFLQALVGHERLDLFVGRTEEGHSGLRVLLQRQGLVGDEGLEGGEPERASGRIIGQPRGALQCAVPPDSDGVDVGCFVQHAEVYVLMVEHGAAHRVHLLVGESLLTRFGDTRRRHPHLRFGVGLRDQVGDTGDLLIGDMGGRQLHGELRPHEPEARQTDVQATVEPLPPRFACVPGRRINVDVVIEWRERRLPRDVGDEGLLRTGDRRRRSGTLTDGREGVLRRCLRLALLALPLVAF